MIIILGDRPSRKNLDKSIAFVGTKSYKKLLEWIYNLDIDINDSVLCNINQIKQYDFAPSTGYIETKNLSAEYCEDDQFIVLGRNAEKVAKRLGVNYFYLPHPSGLNRKLNSEEYVKNILKECRDWLTK
jgi:uracil-DNA glycosylase